MTSALDVVMGSFMRPDLEGKRRRRNPTSGGPRVAGRSSFSGDFGNKGPSLNDISLALPTPVPQTFSFPVPEIIPDTRPSFITGGGLRPAQSFNLSNTEPSLGVDTPSSNSVPFVTESTPQSFDFGGDVQGGPVGPVIPETGINQDDFSDILPMLLRLLSGMGTPNFRRGLV